MPDAPGLIERIHLAAAEGGPLESVQAAECAAGLGLEGDRLVTAARSTAEAGTLPAVKSMRQLTLIAAEAMEAARAESGLDLPDGITRRNVTVRGLDLDAMVGRTFQVGAATVRGIEPCAPCGYLERLTGIVGIKAAFAGRGGLRCEVIGGGRIAVGDEVGALSPP